MSQRWDFDEKEPFLDKIRALREAGHRPSKLEIITPYHVHGTDELLELPRSPLRFFTL